MLITLVPEESIVVYRSIEDLVRGIDRLYDKDTILLFQARDREDLLRLVSLRDLLEGLRVVLLIPDREEETVSLSHRLRPRFLGNSDNDFSVTISVLQKMMEHMDEGQEAGSPPYVGFV